MHKLVEMYISTKYAIPSSGEIYDWYLLVEKYTNTNLLVLLCLLFHID